MTVITVDVDPPYDVHVGAGALTNVAPSIAHASSCAVIADQRAFELHGDKLGTLSRLARLDLPRGEAAKDFPVLERALEFLAREQLDRSACVVVFGGGAACDLGGLAASLYMRGIGVVHCPTTLLAQVDASVGGKTAINLSTGKNLAGTFHQPRAVFADTSTLETLDEDQLRSGFGEIVKTALICAPSLFERVEASTRALLARDRNVLTELIASCVRVKASVVASDERDFGARKVLNLGHTFGHAIETAAGHGRVPHGVAVAVGVVLALRTSCEIGLANDAKLLERTQALLERLRLPNSLGELRARSRLRLTADELLDAMRSDKKGRRAEPLFVLPRAIGSLELDVRVTRDVLARVCA